MTTIIVATWVTAMQTVIALTATWLAAATAALLAYWVMGSID